MLPLVDCLLLWSLWILFFFFFHEGLALITQREALLWTDGRYFLQAIQQLSDQWKLMRIGEDPPVDLWMADVCDHLFEGFTSH